MGEFAEREWRSRDGLTLYARDYAAVGGERGLPVICLHGLTRNSKDFTDVAPRIAAGGRRVIVPDVRGRGRSDYDPNPKRYQPGTTFPRYLAPYHAWRYDQDETMKKVVELGLIGSAKNASPVFSNYPINWLLMYSDLKTFGYNPYAPEFSTLIREGKANKQYWKIMGKIVDFITLKKIYLGRHVVQHMKWLGLDDKDLKITRPSRRDWPDFVYQADARAV